MRAVSVRPEALPAEGLVGAVLLRALEHVHRLRGVPGLHVELQALVAGESLLAPVADVHLGTALGRVDGAIVVCQLFLLLEVDLDRLSKVGD